MSVVSRKEVYDKMVQESAICWWKLYEEEKAKRLAIEEKYEGLTRKIKENAIKEVSERDIEWNGKLQYVDFGAGDREVHHKLKTVGNTHWEIEDDIKSEEHQERAECLAKIIEMAREEGEL